jgi:hypothetical protein
MVDALDGTAIGRTAQRAAKPLAEGEKCPESRVTESDVEVARRRAREAQVRAKRAAQRAAMSLELSARLHEAVADVQQEESAKVHRGFAEEDRSFAKDKRREAAAE